MGYKLFDFECLECGIFEELVDDKDSWAECPECGVLVGQKVLAAPNLATYSIASPEQKSEILKKRSAEHSKREIRKDAEKFGAEGKKRAREGQIMSAGGLGKKK